MKNLETEYRKAFTEEMPDLWGRIESNLPPKNISAKKSRVLIYRYGGLAAAAVFLAIVIPGSLSLMNQNTKNDEMLQNGAISLKATETKQIQNEADAYEEAVCDTATQDSAPAASDGTSLQNSAESEMNAVEENSAEAVLNENMEISEIAETIGYYTVLEYWEADGGRIYALKQKNITVTALLSKESMKEMENKDFSLEAGEEYLFTLEDSSSEDFTYRIIGVK